MKRRLFVRELLKAKCVERRSSGRHDVYFNPATGRSAPVPRHAEIPDTLCNLIRRQLGLER